MTYYVVTQRRINDRVTAYVIGDELGYHVEVFVPYSRTQGVLLDQSLTQALTAWQSLHERR